MPKSSDLRLAATAFALAALCAVGPAARAAVLTLSNTQSIPSSGIVVFEVDKFDPALGTLLSVQLNLQGDGFTYFTSRYENYSGTLQTGTAVVIARANIVGVIFPGDGLNAHQDLVGPVSVPYSVEPAMGGFQDFFSHSGVAPAYNFSTAVAMQPSVINAYTGPGTKTLNGAFGGFATFTPDSGSYHLVPSPQGNLAQEGSTATASVIYTYDAVVPEPNSLAVSVMGGIALLGRRRFVSSG